MDGEPRRDSPRTDRRHRSGTRKRFVDIRWGCGALAAFLYFGAPSWLIKSGPDSDSDFHHQCANDPGRLNQQIKREEAKARSTSPRAEAQKRQEVAHFVHRRMPAARISWAC